MSMNQLTIPNKLYGRDRDINKLPANKLVKFRVAKAAKDSIPGMK